MGLNVRHHHLRWRKFPHGKICREYKSYDGTLAFALNLNLQLSGGHHSIDHEDLLVFVLEIHTKKSHSK